MLIQLLKYHQRGKLHGNHDYFRSFTNLPARVIDKDARNIQVFNPLPFKRM